MRTKQKNTIFRGELNILNKYNIQMSTKHTTNTIFRRAVNIQQIQYLEEH